MKRAAFFVEGKTELIFVERLLREIAGEKNIVFDLEEWLSKSFLSLQSGTSTGESYFALIVDCHSDGAIVSAIRSRHAELAAAGYDLVVGLRDLYPLTHADLQELKDGIASVLPTNSPACHVAIAVAEVEAWFLQEHSHFSKVDPAFTHENILAATGYDFLNDFAEDLVNPAEILNLAYKITGKAYNKKSKNIQRTVDSLDYAYLYADLRGILVSFDEFAEQIDNFLS